MQQPGGPFGLPLGMQQAGPGGGQSGWQPTWQPGMPSWGGIASTPGMQGGTRLRRDPSNPMSLGDPTMFPDDVRLQELERWMARASDETVTTIREYLARHNARIMRCKAIDPAGDGALARVAKRAPG